jgi:outer membrane receptor protein involved in Fe transport
MTRNVQIARAVRHALFTSAVVAASAGVYGQDQDQEQDAGSDVQTVTVTGTRILKRDAIAESPIVTVTNETLVDSGYGTVEHYLNTLPQIVPGLSSQSNNPSSNGRAFIDLRGMGTNRNLVLIDGRRGMGSTSGGVVDINTIPAALIENVEVITGGAGATYGPDAVAGVVNFITKKSFEGVALNSTYNLTEQSDGQEVGADLTFGGSFAEGQGNAVFNFSYFKRDDLYKDARAFSAQASNTTPTFPGGAWTTGTNTPSQAAVDGAFGANSCNTNGGFAGFGFNPDGSVFCTGVQDDPTRQAVGFNGPENFIATRFFPDIFSYNFEPDNILVLPMERWSLYSHTRLEMSDKFQPYMSAQFTNYNALQELAATPASGTTGFTIPVTNPFIPAGSPLANMLASRANPTAPFTFSKRFSDLGGRTGYNTHDVWNLVAGTKGEISSKWSYDVYGTYGRSVQNEVQGGNVRRDRVQQLLDSPSGGALNAAGTAVGPCPGGLNLIGNAPISQVCRDFISLEAKNLTTVEQNIVEAVVNGDLFDLPAGTVQTAVGAGYRDLSFNFQPDSGLQPGLVAGFNQQLPVSGQLNYTDYFAEVSVPLLADLPLLKRLSVTGGYRSTDNNKFGRDGTWKGTLDWSLNDWGRIRGGVQHAVRAPNISELFSPQLNNFPTFTNQDPCNTSGTIAGQFRNGPNGAQVAALCAAQSAVAGGVAYGQPAGQANGITGGNPDLVPEKADSFTAGFVFASPFDSDLLSRLQFSVDYWSIELEDAIDSIDAVLIVHRCYNKDNANPSFDINNEWCQLFNRDQGNGGVIELQQLQQNQAFVNTSGVDLGINWGIGMGGAGDLGFQLVATWLEKFEEQSSTADPVFDYAGAVGNVTGETNPEYKATLVTTYSRPNLQVQLTSRYIDAMIHRNVANASGSPLTNTGVPSTWYFDLAGKYEVFENFTIRLGVNNLLDQEPRLYSPNIQANTDPSLYDVLGRRYFAGLEWRM